MKRLVVTLSLSLLGGFAFAGILQDPNAKEDSIKKDLPLLPERQFEITSSEGSWMSLDVSPDGQTIAFDFLGDLYTMPFSGGAAKQISNGMAFDSQPTFSPDGRKLVYTSDKSGGEGVWTVDLQTSKEEQITSGKADRYQSPEWSPDGQYIFASKAGLRRGPLKIWMYHADGGTGVPLMKGPDPKTDDVKMTGAAFGPDGRYLWYGQRNRDWQYNAIFPQYQVGRYDRETGKKETMSFRFGSGFRPTLSPDGQWLVYGTRFDGQTGLRLRDLKSGVEKWLAYPVQRDDQESRGTRDALPGMSFTPDSKEVVASYNGKIWRLPITGGSAIEIPFAVSTQIELGAQLDFDYPIPDSATFMVKQIRDGVPSPDGKKLAFTALDRLYVMDLQGRQPARVTKHDFTEAQPTWSPDGEWLAYTTWDAGQGKVFKTKVAGRRPGTTLQLTNDNAVYEQPAWSPDGSKIVILKGPATNYQYALNQSARGTAREIVWVSAEDGGPTNFVDYSYGRRYPHFSNRSDRIFLFHSDNGLTSIRWDGTNEKNHLKVVGPKPPGFDDPIKASRIIITPDEKGAIAKVYNDMYWMAFPQVSDKAPKIDVSQGEKAAFPVRKLSDIGGQFMAICKDGNQVYWSIGNALVTYDLNEGKRMADQRKSVADTFKEEGKKLSDDTLKYDPSEYRIKIQANRDLPKGTVALKGATLITMNGDEVIRNGVVLIKDNRILEVGPSVTIPPNAQVIDVSGKTIVPGFVDTHAHVRPAWNIHKGQAWQFFANLAYGVTTVRDPQTSSTDILTYEDKVKAGMMIGPRIYSTGPGMFWQEQITDLDHAKKLVSRYSDYYDTKTIKMYVAGNRQQRQWILMACRENKIMPTTEGSLNFKQNLTQIIDGYPGHEHSFPVFPLYKDAVELIAMSQTSYTPTLLVAYGGPWAENYFYTRENPHDDTKLRYYTPHEDIDRKTRRRGQGTGPGPGGWFMDEEHVFDKLAKVVNAVVEAGGKAGVGSHGQLQGLGYHWELWAVQSGGMTPHNALKVATIQGAEAIGLEKELGSLQPGKLADLVVLENNPLENIRHSNTIVSVMRNGRMYDANTLAETYPNSGEAPPRSWIEPLPEQK